MLSRDERKKNLLVTTVPEGTLQIGIRLDSEEWIKFEESSSTEVQPIIGQAIKMKDKLSKELTKDYFTCLFKRENSPMSETDFNKFFNMCFTLEGGIISNPQTFQIDLKYSPEIKKRFHKFGKDHKFWVSKSDKANITRNLVWILKHVFSCFPAEEESIRKTFAQKVHPDDLLFLLPKEVE